MSETEKHIGKLVKVPFQDGESIDDVIARVLKENNIEMQTWHNDVVECFMDELSEDYVISGESVYNVTRIPIEPYEDIMYAALDADGNIDFVVEFYNGGCSFSEAIDTALSNM